MQDELTLSLPPRKTQEQVCPEVTTSFDKVGYLEILKVPETKTLSTLDEALLPVKVRRQLPR